MHWRLGCVLGVLLATAGGCDRGSASRTDARSGPQAYPYKVVATVGMVADVVRGVAGEYADVTSLIGSGVDPHLYKVTTDDMRQLRAADVIFYNGLLLEGKMASVLERIGERKPVFAAAGVLDPNVLLRPDGNAAHADPHVWMDASLWRRVVDAVAQQLSDFDPNHTDVYAANAAQIGAEIDKLHAYVQRVIASIPNKQRVLVTAHDAFNYFGRAYGVEVLGVQGISTESEAGIDDINQLVDLLVERKVQAVFVETSVADKSVRSLIEGAAARGHAVKIGGELFSDAMGEPGTYRGTYVGMLDHNATTIARALGGEAPAGGMQGRLD